MVQNLLDLFDSIRTVVLNFFYSWQTRILIKILWHILWCKFFRGILIMILRFFWFTTNLKIFDGTQFENNWYEDLFNSQKDLVWAPLHLIKICHVRWDWKSTLCNSKRFIYLPNSINIMRILFSHTLKYIGKNSAQSPSRFRRTLSFRLVFHRA